MLLGVEAKQSASIMRSTSASRYEIDNTLDPVRLIGIVVVSETVPESTRKLRYRSETTVQLVASPVSSGLSEIS